MLYTEPIPPIDGNPFPAPAPPGAAAAAADAGFTGWSSNLAPVEQQLGALAQDLGNISSNLGSAEAPLAGAVQQLEQSPLPQTLGALAGELSKPNPMGTTVPYVFTIPQLPSQTPPTQQTGSHLDQLVQQYLNDLLAYIIALGYIPPSG